ncbi:FAD binding domain-containing protein [Bacillus taeanensis]|uniref:Xanthine dehydrogenase n=1 Tax=Bacillus taeanensis TaxID=273032 RepID=A0A366XQM9_9BACI|nr:FAD binding domain-containing protein [Bacillus taeanensis]RBW68422.1 xanthine dehydrogenase [Bacillus taeanensis]
MEDEGGTEIITLGRLNLVYTRAVIDIKGIPECSVLTIRENRLVIGSALSLTKIEEENLFPLLSKTASEVADHTARNKVTLGGNICGQIFYREAVLPLLLSDSRVVIAGEKGIRELPINLVFNKQLQLEKGEFLVQILTDKSYLEVPYVSIKKRQQWDTGYPLVTVASIKKEDKMRVAFSGVCPFPFRSQKIEEVLNEKQLPYEERVQLVFRYLPQPILNDTEGSSDYRLFVLKNTLLHVLRALEGEENGRF